GEAAARGARGDEDGDAARRAVRCDRPHCARVRGPSRRWRDRPPRARGVGPRVRLVLAITAVAIACAALAAQAGADRPSAPLTLESLAPFAPATGAVRSAARARPNRCGGRGAYGWPVRPFDRPHPVRGNMGDPRTVYSVKGGSFSFHNGVDVVAPN